MREIARLVTVVLALAVGLGPIGCGSEPDTPDAVAVAADVAALDQLYRQARSGDGASDEGIEVLRDLHERGRLEAALDAFAREMVARGVIDESYLRFTPQVIGLVTSELCLRGLLPECGQMTHESWVDITARHDHWLATLPEARGSLGDPATRDAIADLAGSSWVPGNAVEALVDGPASWAKRGEMIAGAKRRIDLLTWAFYDDLTGWEGARALAAKAEQGVEVRVVVDGRMPEHVPYGAVVEWLEQRSKELRESDEGVLEVIRYRHPDRPTDGQHRKILLVDEAHLVAGGMNYGDWYSHQNPKEPKRWRDTDVYVRGPAAAEAARLFRRLWREQAEAHGLDAAQASAEIVTAEPAGPASVALVDHDPARGDEHVLLSTIRAIESAEASIDVETAYYIRIPSLDAALRRAIERGVRVRLLTNSATSVDETFLVHAILVSAKSLSDAGAEVFLRKGSTLHSKFMVIDGVFASIGSYNLHPRSYRMEGEEMFHVFDEGLAKELEAAFERDLGNATKIVPGEPFEIPEDPLCAIALQYFPDQL